MTSRPGACESNEPIVRHVVESFGLLWSSPRAVALDAELRRTHDAARRHRR